MGKINVPKTIDQIIASRRMSRRQLAIAAGIPPSSLQAAMARGKSMTVEMLEAIATALEIEPAELLIYSQDNDLDGQTKPDDREIVVSTFGYVDKRIERQILAVLAQLNEDGQKEIIAFAKYLTKKPLYQLNPPLYLTDEEQCVLSRALYRISNHQYEMDLMKDAKDTPGYRGAMRSSITIIGQEIETIVDIIKQSQMRRKPPLQMASDTEAK